MSLKSCKSAITRNLINLLGWRTTRKIVVIESDDWGSVRMSSKEAYNYLLTKGIPVDNCPYNRYDALECNEDLEELFNVLGSVKDSKGNPALLTANAVMANPDFDKIRESDFQKYYYEPFTKTLERYPAHDHVYALYHKGINDKLFIPQFHGREHVNVARWMQALQVGDDTALTAFKWKMFSLHTGINSGCRGEYLDAFAVENLEEQLHLRAIVAEGLTLFNDLIGYKSRTCIAPCYAWNSDIEQTLFEHDVQAMQGVLIQKVSLFGMNGSYKRRYHYTGQRNHLSQSYVVRNCFFEPSLTIGLDPVPNCLIRIRAAFAWHKPAIISTHRLNFMGLLNSSNREKNLNHFKKLLIAITKHWPDVEFLSSDQLADLILENVDHEMDSRVFLNGHKTNINC